MNKTAEIKEAIRQRDGYRCVDCGRSQEEVNAQTGSLSFKRLDVHRTIRDGQYSLENCVTVCRKCHKRRHFDDIVDRQTRYYEEKAARLAKQAEAISP